MKYNKMPKNLIVIEKGNNYQFDNEQDLVKKILGENYYELTKSEKIEIIKLKALASSLNLKHSLSFNIEDEKTFILSLLIDNEELLLLERKDANIYLNKLDKSQFTKNYILVNKFAKHLLEV